MSNPLVINELEISINNICNLRCSECGFKTPHQPYPSLIKDIVDEHFNCLKILENNQVKINSLGILGGEPSLTPDLLEKAVTKFSRLKNIGQIEVITNGLYPQGFSQKTLQTITKLSISVYQKNTDFIDSWNCFITKKFPHIKLDFRVEKLWSINSEELQFPNEEAQHLFSECWYKKHCQTIERSRLFLCSIAAKNCFDSDGLLVTNNTTQTDIYHYITRNIALEKCKTCCAAKTVKTIKAGLQPKEISLQQMMSDAATFLNQS